MFRLWLSSLPDKNFPNQILKNSIKVTSEPPTGLKQTIKNIYQNIDEEVYDLENLTYKKLLLLTTFFHAIIQGRKDYGPYGWNNIYDWLLSDFWTSNLQLRSFSFMSEIPYDAVYQLVGLINYGGRITDSNDQSLIQAILASLIQPKNLEEEDQCIMDLPEFKLPVAYDYESIIEYIDNLPNKSSTELLGLNQNADILLNKKDYREMIECLNFVFPRIQ